MGITWARGGVGGCDIGCLYKSSGCEEHDAIGEHICIYQRQRGKGPGMRQEEKTKIL